MSQRCLWVRPEFIEKVKSAYKRARYVSQSDLAEHAKVSLDTVSKFLNGKPISRGNFQALCKRLGLDWQAIANLDPQDSNIRPTPASDEPQQPTSLQLASDPNFVGRESAITNKYLPGRVVNSDSVLEQQNYNEHSQRGAYIPNPRNQVFGREQLIEKVLNRLTDPQGWTIFSLSGGSGYGKTEAANCIALAAFTRNLFKDVLWVKARQTELVEGIITPETRSKALDWDQFRIEIAYQLNCPIERVQRRFREERLLVVIDNAETADMTSILSKLFPMLNPSRALLTSRLDYEPRFVRQISIPGLDKIASRQLLRYEAESNDIPVLLQASDEQLDRVHQLSCGAPLALHFVVSRVRDDKALEPILFELERADRQVDCFYQFTLETAWQRINDAAKRVLRYIGRADASVTQAELLGAGGLSQSDLNAAKRELRRWHLLEDLQDAKGEWRYELHPWVRRSVRKGLVDRWQPSLQDLEKKFKWKFDGET